MGVLRSLPPGPSHRSWAVMITSFRVTRHRTTNKRGGEQGLVFVAQQGGRPRRAGPAGFPEWFAAEQASQAQAAACLQRGGGCRNPRPLELETGPAQHWPSRGHESGERPFHLEPPGRSSLGPQGPDVGLGAHAGQGGRL